MRSHINKDALSIFLCVSITSSLWGAEPPCVGKAPKIDAALPLLFCEDFESGNTDNWEPADANAWRIVRHDSNTVFDQFAQSKVINPVRSPFNRCIVKDINVGSFVFDVRLKSTSRDYPHRSLCLFFGFQDPSHLYYVHFGKRTDDHANQIFIVNEAPRTKISLTTTPGTNWDDEWHHARIVRDVKSGLIEIYYDDMEKPVMTARDTTFKWGHVGIGSFDDTGEFDDIYLFGEKANPPGSVE